MKSLKLLKEFEYRCDVATEMFFEKEYFENRVATLLGNLNVFSGEIGIAEGIVSLIEAIFGYHDKVQRLRLSNHEMNVILKGIFGENSGILEDAIIESSKGMLSHEQVFERFKAEQCIKKMIENKKMPEVISEKDYLKFVHGVKEIVLETSILILQGTSRGIVKEKIELSLYKFLLEMIDECNLNSKTQAKMAKWLMLVMRESDRHAIKKAKIEIWEKSSWGLFELYEAIVKESYVELFWLCRQVGHAYIKQNEGKKIVALLDEKLMEEFDKNTELKKSGKSVMFYYELQTKIQTAEEVYEYLRLDKRAD